MTIVSVLKSDGVVEAALGVWLRMKLKGTIEMLLSEKWNKGLTLIELIMVISIIGTLSTVAIPTFSRLVKETKEEVCMTNRL